MNKARQPLPLLVLQILLEVSILTSAEVVLRGVAEGEFHHRQMTYEDQFEEHQLRCCRSWRPVLTLGTVVVLRDKVATDQGFGQTNEQDPE